MFSIKIFSIRWRWFGVFILLFFSLNLKWTNSIRWILTSTRKKHVDDWLFWMDERKKNDYITTTRTKNSVVIYLDEWNVRRGDFVCSIHLAYDMIFFSCFRGHRVYVLNVAWLLYLQKYFNKTKLRPLIGPSLSVAVNKFINLPFLALLVCVCSENRNFNRTSFRGMKTRK